LAERVEFTSLSGLLPFSQCCPACRGPTREGFCAGCAAEFLPIHLPCPRCGLPGPVLQCPRRLGPWPLRRTFAPYEYAYPLDYYLQSLKFGHGRMLGRALALLLRAPMREARERGELTADLLVPVPLHPLRLRERGYNQATEIARTLAAGTSLRVVVADVRRIQGAAAQSSLGARARRANVARAFSVNRSFSGRRVAIVDDVVTTGATLNALATALLAAGAESVEAVAIARTVSRSEGKPDDG
jgi:ComF family protein